MNFNLVLMLLGLISFAVIFSTINCTLSEKRTKTFRGMLALGLSKVLSDVSIGLIIAAIPIMLLLNYLKPQPEDIMPAFAYDGVYSEIADDIDESSIEFLISDCTVTIEEAPSVEKIFDRSFLYYKTGNFDLAQIDLQQCVELEVNWMYYYDMGIIYGYLLDYTSAIEYLEMALSKDIPISERGNVINTLAMIENYYESWVYSILK